ncbi:putative malate dehydrogenase 1B isoform X2 [Tubulanus polymorphus]|uniref:putative malate dehydrogenase 1B isoform X2 n=1 Tax=Tubulanus polymorphus TaxID=672921 RepID=UPI003DA4D6DD
MAKVVIAGCASCPYYARVELLADKLSKNLNDFKLHKIVKRKEEWQDWLNETCKERGWTHTKSPLIWRELVDRGGKAVIIGGANDFQEYAKGYYGDVSELTSDDMTKIADENLKTKIELDNEEKERRALSKPVHVCITNATSAVAYNLIPAFARGDILGPNVEVNLHLLDTEEENQECLRGVQMEAQDLANELLREVTVFTDPEEAFKGCWCIVMLDELEFEPETDQSAKLAKYYEYFTKYSETINNVSSKDVRVLVASSGPINFIVDIISRTATNVKSCDIVGLSRLFENRAKAVLAQRLNVNSASVADVIIWGNVNGNKYVDINNSRVHHYDGAVWGPPFYSVPVLEKIYDRKWLESEFMETVNQREENLKTALRHHSATSHGSAISTLLSHWFQGCSRGEIYSLVVKSEGWYEVPENTVCSMPVTFFPPGYWAVVEDINMSDESMQKVKDCVSDIKSELDVIFAKSQPVTDTDEDQTQTLSESAGDGTKKEQTELVSDEGTDVLSRIDEQDELNGGSKPNSDTNPDEEKTTEEEKTVDDAGVEGIVSEDIQDEAAQET